jgi:hypothetical protein
VGKVILKKKVTTKRTEESAELEFLNSVWELGTKEE